MGDTFPKSTVLSMKDQVDYADGAIVSKQVIKMPAGNLTLFAFDKGQELSEHSAPFDALVPAQLLNSRKLPVYWFKPMFT
jgi:quercetin dioxygenase-like cupin family protein